MAKVTGAELLRLLRAEADRVADIAGRLREAVDTVTDPTAAEAEVEAARAAAEQRTAEAGRVRADAEKMLAGYRAEAAATGRSCEPTSGPGPSAPSGTPTPTATNWPACAPGPTMTLMPWRWAGRPAGPGRPPSRNPVPSRPIPAPNRPGSRHLPARACPAYPQQAPEAAGSSSPAASGPPQHCTACAPGSASSSVSASAQLRASSWPQKVALSARTV